MKNYLFAFLLLITAVPAGAQNIAGIGAQLIMDTTGGHTMPRIYSLVKGSPAYDSLRATDYIIKVNDVSCLDLTLEAVVALIRGEVGTRVKVTTANTKEGEAPRDHELVRVGMNIPQPADPKEAFYAACENEVKQMRKSGVTVVKTFNSDCGNYFFNFDGSAGVFKIKVIMMADKDASFRATAKAFDNDREAEATSLGQLDAKAAAGGNPQLQGAVTFTKECVGTVGITLLDDDKKCRAMYVVVSKNP